MIGITYPGIPGKATTFAYDGLGRRATISHTLTGGGATVASTYVWCGDKPCQARNASNQPQRAYYTEGERLLGSSSQSLFYGVDQIGSVRRVFASPTSAPAYGYDPYGVPLQTTAPLTDFGYAGLINEPDSGLGLATYRAYDPRVGRWLSRDPIGEAGDRGGNLYAYADGDPLYLVDPIGLQVITPETMTHIVNAHGANTPRTRPNNSTFTPEYSSPEAIEQLAKDICAQPGGRSSRNGYDEIYGQVMLRNNEAGQMQGYVIGKESSGAPTNAVTIRVLPDTLTVITMFPGLPPR